MTYPFGIDISKWQWDSKLIQSPDFAKVKANTSFVLVKSTESWGYIDPTFVRNWQGLVGHNRVAYCYVYPESDPLRQANYFIDTVTRAGVDWDYDRLALDLERSNHGKTKAQVTMMVLVMMERIKEMTGRYPILYSRKTWVDSNMIVTDSRLTDADWWLANYLWRRPAPLYTPEKDPPPALPNGVRRWLIHQTGERGDGSAVGVISHFVDTDRWNGTEDQMLAYFGLIDDSAPLPPKPPEVQEPLFEAKVVTVYPNRLRTRYSPAGVVRPEVDWYQSGQVVSVYETKPDWYRTAVETWASAEWLRRLDYQEPPVVDLAYWGPVYNQRDKRWKDLPLGTKSTIGAHGCLITCASMDCNYFGHASNPRQLNEWLTNNEGYLSGNLFLWEKLEELYPDMKFDGFVYYPSEAQIADYIRRGQLPIMHVDFDDSTPLIEMHWVLGVGIENGNVVIADPWTGAMGYLFDTYPKSVIRFGSYSRRAQ